jgi:hypothetical protein
VYELGVKSVALVTNRITQSIWRRLIKSYFIQRDIRYVEVVQMQRCWVTNEGNEMVRSSQKEPRWYKNGNDPVRCESSVMKKIYQSLERGRVGRSGSTDDPPAPASSAWEAWGAVEVARVGRAPDEPLGLPCWPRFQGI